MNWIEILRSCLSCNPKFFFKKQRIELKTKMDPFSLYSKNTFGFNLKFWNLNLKFKIVLDYEFENVKEINLYLVKFIILYGKKKKKLN